MEEVRQDWNSNTTNTQCIFIDLKKAFDTVDQILLLEKCDAYGFRGPVFDLLKSYLKTDNNTLPLQPNALKLNL